MAIPVNFSPLAIDFHGVPPASDGPNISVDPSFGPPAISFAGGVQVPEVPAADAITATIEDDAAGVYRVRDITVMEWTLEPVDPGELPPGHHGPPPKVKVLEIVSQSSGTEPVSVIKGQFVLVRVAYAAPAERGLTQDFTGTLVIEGNEWQSIRVSLALHLALAACSFPESLTIVQGAEASVPVLIRSVAGAQTNVTFEMSLTQLDTGITLVPNLFSLDPGDAISQSLTFHADPDAPPGANMLAIDELAFNQRQGFLLPTNILPAGAPAPDPRVDPFDVVYMPESTVRICQLTGAGDPEGKPHPNDTTRFALLGTDLGTSFDHNSGSERRTYFFFGDTHTGEGDQDGDAIAFTTDGDPEPDGLHLQFMMGDNQWHRLVIPGVSLGTLETPTGGFSHANRLFVFATTGVLRQDGSELPQSSVLASAADAHDNFDLAFFVSSRDDTSDTPDTGGKFINVAPWKISNDGWPGLPDNAALGGDGLLMVGSGKYRASAPYLAYMPLRPGETPQKADLRYLKGFDLWEPGFGPSGPPSWSEAESDAMPLFTDQIGELSLVFNTDLRRWLLVYNGCMPGHCGILLRSAPRPWGPWSETPQLIFESARDGAQGKYMFECGPYGPYVISRYNRFDPTLGDATIYYTLSNGECRDRDHADYSEPHYQVHLMKSRLRLVNK